MKGPPIIFFAIVLLWLFAHFRFVGGEIQTPLSYQDFGIGLGSVQLETTLYRETRNQPFRVDGRVFEYGGAFPDAIFAQPEVEETLRGIPFRFFLSRYSGETVAGVSLPFWMLAAGWLILRILLATGGKKPARE